MATSGGVLWTTVRHSWIAFCSGWWLAGIVLGFSHFTDLLARPSPGVLEASGVAVVMGGLLPGGVPFWHAADIVGVSGLPVGFTGFFIGAGVTIVVWGTLPLALSVESHHTPDRATRRQHLIVAAIPYLAAAAGLAHLTRTYRSRGRTRFQAGVFALATAVLAYGIAAAIIFVVGFGFLS